MKPKYIDPLTTKELEEITKLSDRRLRQLASAGFIPPPIRGKWPRLETLARFIDYQRQRLSERSDNFHTERTLLTRAKRVKTEIEVDVLRKQYVSRADVCETIGLLARSKRLLLQRKLEVELPPKLVGLGVIEITQAMERTVDELCTFLAGGVEKYCSAEDLGVLKRVEETWAK